MRPEPPNRIHDCDNRRDLDVGGDAATIPKKSKPRLQKGVVQDIRKERPPVLCGAVFSRDRHDPLRRIDQICEGTGMTGRESRTTSLGNCRGAPAHLRKLIGWGT